MSGQLILSVSVGPNGEVQTVRRVSNSGMSDGAATCVERVVKAALFTAVGGSGATVDVPMTFVQSK